MLIDVRGFIAAEEGEWRELERLLDRLEADAAGRLDVAATRRFHYLYQRAAAGLVRLHGVEPETCRYLERLVGRAWSEIHETRGRGRRFAPWTWLARTLPRTFRRRGGAFALALALFLLGAVFGGGLLLADPALKPDLLPYDHLQGNPAERVAREERGHQDRTPQAAFASFLMTHNVQVSIMVLAFGMSYGVGTVIVLFQNGVVLGAVAADYLAAGQGVFLAGWLLPHGVIEIPAFLIAAQAGLLLAAALIGYHERLGLRARLRAVRDDVITLVLGSALLLVWAGLVEAFLAQHHEPVVPYALKIAFGLLEAGGLGFYLLGVGRAEAEEGGRDD